MGQRGPEGVGKAMTICSGAGMVQMGSYWVEFETYEATLRTPKIDMWSEGARGGGESNDHMSGSWNGPDGVILGGV